MPPLRPRPARKQEGQYHHGDLRRAMLQAAVRTIDRHGVEAVTLRAVGASLGVSRTALYRHFQNKSSLLTAVAAEGFTTLRELLLEAWKGGGRGLKAFAAMGRAYVRFAIEHPAHYRVMFGGFPIDDACEPELKDSGTNAFMALVDALAALQQAGLVRKDDVQRQAAFVWATVHGISMLSIDRQLGPDPADGSALVEYAIRMLMLGLGPPGVAEKT
ncbi:MAG: TetR/AcrR family transcriptional regulator [Gemmatimonadaceae bacterium]